MLTKYIKIVIRTILFLGIFLLNVNGRYPFKPPPHLVPFTAYFKSPYRGMCMGTLVSRRLVLTAAVCCVHPVREQTTSINVVIGTLYRHVRRGHRIQVTTIMHPRFPNITSRRSYAIQNSAALMVLKRSVPRQSREMSPQSLSVNFDRTLRNFLIREECFTAGYHFFFKEDRIFRGVRFLLQRNLRVQFLEVVNERRWCSALHFKFQKYLQHLGFEGIYFRSDAICLKDSDELAQPCHGMYGAPLICNGQLIGMLSAPDAQWKNCTGRSNLFHLLSNTWSAPFLGCTKSLFNRPDIEFANVNALKSKYLVNAENPEFRPQYENILSGQDYEDY